MKLNLQDSVTAFLNGQADYFNTGTPTPQFNDFSPDCLFKISGHPTVMHNRDYLAYLHTLKKHITSLHYTPFNFFPGATHLTLQLTKTIIWNNGVHETQDMLYLIQSNAEGHISAWQETLAHTVSTTPAKVNTRDIQWITTKNGAFSYQRKALSSFTLAKALGASLYRLMPGEKAFPYHYHHANEEAIFILEGEGQLRLNDVLCSITAQDYIACPAGNKHAHQILNTSNKPLIYLCLSTMNTTDVMHYPDSQKTGIMTGTAPGAKKSKQSEKAFFLNEQSVDYYAREPD